MIWKLNLPLVSQVHKNKAVLMVSLEKLNWRYYKEVKFSQKYPRFNEVTWKFELLLLSGGKIFAKGNAVLLMSLENLTCSYITRRNFCKNKAVLMMPLENLNYPYYHEMKLLQKYPGFNKVIWTFQLPALSWGIIFSNMKQSSWCLLIIWPSPIITKWNLR